MNNRNYKLLTNGKIIILEFTDYYTSIKYYILKFLTII